MLASLSHEEKVRLAKFVCSFAWADLEIDAAERRYVADLIAKMELPDEDREQIESWMDSPPSEDDLDPQQIPREHRRLFLDTMMEMVTADGVVDRMEVENYAIFELLMTDPEDPVGD